MIKNADKHDCAGFTSATKNSCERWHFHLKLSASFITKTNKTDGEFGPLAIMHHEDKMSDMERAWSARSKPHDLMQENSVIFHNELWA